MRLPRKLKWLGALVLASAVVVFFSAFSLNSTDEADILEKRVELVIRKIGHDLLLQSGDMTSRIMPVKKLGASTFQLEFGVNFSFKSDSLVDIVNRSLAKANLPIGHIVQVFDCVTSEMIYGFEVLSESATIDPCLGRVQPSGCYTIRVTFTKPLKSSAIEPPLYLGIVILLGMVTIVLWPRLTSAKIKVDAAVRRRCIVLGNLEVDEQSGMVKNGRTFIQLSNKESSLLKVLAENVNRLVDRDYLQNEIWKKEGVITGRSLDMFISKLRKKLGSDSGVKIVNVRGRGYRFENF